MNDIWDDDDDDEYESSWDEAFNRIVSSEQIPVKRSTYYLQALFGTVVCIAAFTLMAWSSFWLISQLDIIPEAFTFVQALAIGFVLYCWWMVMLLFTRATNGPTR